MSLIDKDFIGKVNSGASEKAFTSKGTGDIFTESGEEEINEAVHNAYRSFILYKNISAEFKVEFLERIKRSIESQLDILSVTAHKETSLPQKRLHAEIVRTINQVQLFI